jgi:MinD-like ATPase involved in chromosome partitioning or flagellar assembly
VSIPVLVLLGPTSWEGSFVAGLAHPASRVDVIRRCVDTADLLAAADTGIASVAIVGADAPRLDSDVLARVIDSGVSVIAVTSRDDESAVDRMVAWGAADVVSVNDRDLGQTVTAAIAAVHRLTLRTSTAAVQDLDLAARNGTSSSQDAASVFVVWGPAGSPGRSSVAIGLADEISRVGRDTILIDADTWAPSLALALGLADDGAGLASACRRALSGSLDERSFESILRPINDHLRVLTGIGRSGRWTEVRRSAMLAVIARARAICDVVVIDCGFSLESDEELVFDTAAPRRNASTFVSLEQATDIVVVGLADPIGLVRLVNGLSDLGELELEGRRHVVANRVRESMLGRRPNDAVADVLHRHAGLASVWCIPDDSPGYDKAIREGCTLAEIAPDSPARSAIRSMADALSVPERALQLPA